MDIQYVLFDIDGTISDPIEDISSCINHTLSYFGLHESDPEKLKSYVGPTLIDIFSGYGFNYDECIFLTKKYREFYYQKKIHEIKMYDGIPDMLKTLKDCGCKIGTATCKTAFACKQILTGYGIDSYFDCIAGATLDNKITTKEEVIHSAMDMMGIHDGGPAIMVGDRDLDINGAHLHLIKAMGVTYGYSQSPDELAQADYLAHSPLEISEIILKLMENDKKN